MLVSTNAVEHWNRHFCYTKILKGLICIPMKIPDNMHSMYMRPNMMAMLNIWVLIVEINIRVHDHLIMLKK